MRWLACVAVVVTVVNLAACSSDAPAPVPDAEVVGACGACRSDQICVARYDGTCRLAVACVAPMTGCATNACSAGCEAAYCPRPYQCQNRPPCGGEPSGAFTCYGP